MLADLPVADLTIEDPPIEDVIEHGRSRRVARARRRSAEPAEAEPIADPAP